MPYKIRFNLGKGKNFLKWKVSDPDGNHRYYDPKEVTLLMAECQLVNHKGTAKKIHSGANKTVCAWIKAKAVTIGRGRVEENYKDTFEQVSYNPRVTPNWVMGDKNVDKERFELLVTVERSVFSLTDVK